MKTNLAVHISPKNPDLEFGLSNLEFGNGVFRYQILVHNDQTLICGGGDGIILYIGGIIGGPDNLVFPADAISNMEK
ncbi:hypothetical protein [Flagellimonas sp.]|uniref:hypothetical protein n=1 Tax=Flagellimonas sp. TaxID=2058762 RepID=UPI003BAA5E78